MPELQVYGDRVLDALLFTIALAAHEHLRQTAAKLVFRRKELTRDSAFLFWSRLEDFLISFMSQLQNVNLAPT